MIKLSREQKKEVVIIYQEEDLLETILFCEEKGYITKEQSKEMIDNCRYNPYPNEDNYWEYKTEYINKLFDILDIDDNEFVMFTREYEEDLLEEENK